MVTRDFLGLVGVRPSLGRTLVGSDFEPGRGHVALLSHSLWRARFASASDVVGRSIVVDDTPYTVVGVLPSTFRSLDELQTGTPARADGRLGVLAPLVGELWYLTSRSSSSGRTQYILARLGDPRMLAAARSEVAAIARPLLAEAGAGLPGTVSYTLAPIGAMLNQGVAERMALLGAAVAVLLLLACANAALLMLERRESRRRQFQIQVALGATGTQFLAEAVVEGVLLGAPAGLLGAAIAWAGVAFVRAAGAAALTGLASAQLTWRLVLFALAVSLTTATLASLVSCLRLLWAEGLLSQPARGVSRTSPRAGFLPSSIVVVQIGLSVGLVVVGAMLSRDFARQAAADVGYRAKGVLTFQVAPSPGRHPDGGTQFFERLLERFRETRGVLGATLVYPGAERTELLSVRVEGEAVDLPGYRAVGDGYFALLGIPIVAGRAFTGADIGSGDAVAIVNEAFARRFWGEAPSALGRRMRIGSFGVGKPVTVVGVARDVPDQWMTFRPEMYLTHTWVSRARAKRMPEMSLLLRAADGEPLGLAPMARRVVSEVDVQQPVYGVRRLEDVVGFSLVRTRLLLVVMRAFSWVATLLAAAGVYVMLAFAVARRTREFGIRLALGASRRDVLQHVLGRALALVGKGIALTLPVTFSAIWLFAAQLFGVTESDPTTCLRAVGSIGLAALLASAVPAWRAVRVDPSIALRHE